MFIGKFLGYVDYAHCIRIITSFLVNAYNNWFLKGVRAKCLLRVTAFFFKMYCI